MLADREQQTPARALRVDLSDSERSVHAGDMLAYVRRTTVKIPDDLDTRLRHEAQRRGTTMAEVTRAALEEHLGAGKRRRLDAAAAGRSGRSDISERIEEIIREEAGSSR